MGYSLISGGVTGMSGTDSRGLAGPRRGAEGRNGLRRRPCPASADERGLLAFDDGAIERDVGDVFAARDVVHDVEHDPLEHRAQGARAGALC